MSSKRICQTLYFCDFVPWHRPIVIIHRRSSDSFTPIKLPQPDLTFGTKELNKMGYSHSSVDSSVPSILPPQVRVPCTPSMLFSIYIVQIVYIYLMN